VADARTPALMLVFSALLLLLAALALPGLAADEAGCCTGEAAAALRAWHTYWLSSSMYAHPATPRTLSEQPAAAASAAYARKSAAVPALRCCCCCCCLPRAACSSCCCCCCCCSCCRL
jgi:hypothetical protein